MEPYPHIVQDDILSQTLLYQLMDFVQNLEYSYKQADLFSFLQSPDISQAPELQLLRQWIMNDLRLQMQQLCGELLHDEKLDLHVTVYQDADFLLVHDDQLDDRKIAFLVYLTDMQEHQGGALRLYDTKDDKPNQVVRTIVPKENRLAAFVVSKDSYHDVSEVTDDVQRIALGGWFHVK